MIQARKWMFFSFINFLIVASVGWLMRYKIAFSFPLFNQKFLQHAHSHFAMTGWITHMLFVLIAISVIKRLPLQGGARYNPLLVVNLISAYGMLISFLLQGYGTVSILFSTISILTSYWFAWNIWRDTKRVKNKKPGDKWFRAATFFAVLSSIGTFFLVYLMQINDTHIDRNLSTVYFYLHFQYNGFFIFSCFGLIINRLYDKGWNPRGLNTFFWLYALACVPSYFLSALWLPIPQWVYALVVASALTHCVGWIWFCRNLRQKNLLKVFYNIPKPGRFLLILSGVAYTIKTLLQVGSTVPALNTWAYGFRPIVIGYLHLVFLGIITLFIIGYSVCTKIINPSRTFGIATTVLVIGIILNELALMVQGVTAIRYIMVPYINETLMVITSVMLVGAGLLTVAIFRHDGDISEPKTDTVHNNL